MQLHVAWESQNCMISGLRTYTSYFISNLRCNKSGHIWGLYHWTQHMHMTGSILSVAGLLYTAEHMLFLHVHYWIH